MKTYNCQNCAEKAARRVALNRQCRYPKELAIREFPVGETVIAEAVYTEKPPAGFDLVIRQIDAYVGRPFEGVFGAARILIRSGDREDEQYVFTDSGAVPFSSSYVEVGFDGRPFYRLPVSGETRKPYRVVAQLAHVATVPVPAGFPPTRLLTQLGFEPSWSED